MSALPIFPARLQASIFGAGELNFRVRDGNGWTLTAINTNLLFFEKKSKQKKSEIATRRTDAFAFLTFRLFKGLYLQN